MENNIKIELTKEWQSIEGSLYGLQQAPIIGKVSIRKTSASVTQTIIESLDAQLEIKSKIDNQSLISKIPSWLMQIHKASKISISEVHKIIPISNKSDHQSFWLILPRTHAEVSSLAIKWLVSAINSFDEIHQLNDSKKKLDRSYTELKASISPFSLAGLNMHQILESIFRLNVPVIKVTPSTYMLGTGEYSRWIHSSITDHTSFLGTMIASNKKETADILKQAGLPGAHNKIVKTTEEAVAAAHSLGFPVVVKPADQEQGVGVMSDLCDDTLVRNAFASASKVSKNILVERHVNGFTHRLTVVRGEVMRVSKRIAGGVMGDGIHDIRELIAKLQESSDYRNRSQSIGKELIFLDDEALSLIQQSGLQITDILAKDQYLKLRRRDNVNAGATSHLCELARVHPDNIQLAIDATAALRLDIAGIDLIINDIEQSWRDVDSLICEVNAKPQIVAPEDPLFYDRVLYKIMGGKFRIPLHLVVIPSDMGLRFELIQKWMRYTNCNALSDMTGLRINGVIVSGQFDNGYKAAMAMLGHTSACQAVCLMTLNDIKQMGLPTNQWTTVHVEKIELFDVNEQSAMKQILSLLGPGTRIRQIHSSK